MRVGQIIRIKKNEFIPADLVILHSSNPKGACYVETKNLDGETNLKMKATEKEIYGHFKEESDLHKLDGEVQCELPNEQIYKFEGNITYKSGQDGKTSLGVENMLWRGCSLKNTAYIYGLTVFTGHDTKVMKNSAKSRYKMSNVEVLTNYSIGLILVSQFILSTIGASNGAYFSHYLREDPETKEKNHSCKDMNDPTESGKIECQWAYYLDLSELSTRWIIYFGTWILIFTNFVPISLNVSLELVKLW